MHDAPRQAPRSRRRSGGAVAAAALLAWGSLALPFAHAGAQGGHPLPQAPRSLHSRLALADAAAVVRVESVTLGRITALRREVLLGSVPERFEIKRAPSQPPPLAEGDVAIVLLRGARPTYVLVDEPRETIRLAGATMEARWTDVLRRAAAGAGDAAELADLYSAWIEEGPDSLREIAFQGLLEVSAAPGPLQARVSMERARSAADASQAPEARRLSAQLAVRTPEATAKLLPVVPVEGELPVVVVTVLRAAAAHGQEDALAAFARGLHHGEPGVRSAALQALPALAAAFGPPAIELAEQLTEAEPDASVRRQAVRSLRAARDVVAAAAP